jgi:hypothetical protein
MGKEYWREKKREQRATAKRLLMEAEKRIKDLKEDLSGGVKRPCKHGSTEAKGGLKRAIVQPNNAQLPAQKNLPVPVLADAAGAMHAASSASGEARESTESEQREAGTRHVKSVDSRGGHPSLEGEIDTLYRRCVHCGAAFPVEEGQGLARFCSFRCREVTLARLATGGG